MAVVYRGDGYVLLIHPHNHNPPHIHCIFNDGKAAVFSLFTGNMIVGELSHSSDGRVIKEYILQRQSNLLALWNQSKSGM